MALFQKDRRVLVDPEDPARPGNLGGQGLRLRPGIEVGDDRHALEHAEARLPLRGGAVAILRAVHERPVAEGHGAGAAAHQPGPLAPGQEKAVPQRRPLQAAHPAQDEQAFEPLRHLDRPVRQQPVVREVDADRAEDEVGDQQ